MFRRGFHHRGNPWHDEERHERHEEGHGRHEGRDERHEGRHEGRGERGGRRFGGPGAFWFVPGGRRGFGRGPGQGGPFGDDPFGGPSGGGPFGGRQRQRRGDIKYALLELLAEQPRHGYELIKALEERYAGFYRPSPGTVYPTLQLLEDEGNLSSASENGKRIYTVTDAGKQLLATRGESGGDRHQSHQRHAAPDLDALRDQATALGASVMQVARHGSPEQVRAVLALLEATTREVYGVLASANTPRPTDEG